MASPFPKEAKDTQNAKALEAESNRAKKRLAAATPAAAAVVAAVAFAAFMAAG